MERRKETAAEWLETRPIFDVCVRDTEFEGEGRLQVLWCRKKAAKDQLRVAV